MKEVRIYPSLNVGASTESVGPEVVLAEHTWEDWDEPTYHERKKGYSIVKGHLLQRPTIRLVLAYACYFKNDRCRETSSDIRVSDTLSRGAPLRTFTGMRSENGVNI